MALRTVFRTLIPALVGLVKRDSKKPWVFALSAAIVLLLSTGVGVASGAGGGGTGITDGTPPPTPNSAGVTPSGFGYAGPGGSGGLLGTVGGTVATSADQYQAEFNTSGTLYGTMIAPPPTIGGACSGSSCTTLYGVACSLSTGGTGCGVGHACGGGNQCSNGVRLDGITTSPPSPSNPSGGSTNIVFDNYPNLCRFVDNTSANDYFVPQGSSAEFTDFINHKPSGVNFGYCALGVNYPSYLATASFPTGFYITCCASGPGGPASSAVGGATQTFSVTLPTTRVIAGTLAPPSPQAATFAYTRYDCWPGTTPATPSSCNARAIVETQSLLWSIKPAALPSCIDPSQAMPATDPINCNAAWQAAPAVSCTVDGIYYGPAGSPSCLADYSPPVENGVCSSPSKKDQCAPGGGIVDVASEAYDAATSTWTWICDGEGTGSTDSGTCSYSAVNGVCGTPGIKDSCNPGKPVSETYVPGPPATYTWVCDGLGSGSPSGTCSAPAAANGVCGTPRYSCAPGTAVSESDSGAISSWICDGIAGGSPSGPCSSPDAVPGVCNDTAQYSCSWGAPINEKDDGTTSTWQCAGSGGGADSGGCSIADSGPPPVAGECPAPTAPPYTCLTGTPVSETYEATTATDIWDCNGTGGITIPPCTYPVLVNGACSSPSVEYSCQSGNVDVPSEAYAAGPPATYTWACDGINGGTKASGCTSLAKVDGVCSSPSVRYTCAPGSAVSETDNGTTSKWICDGTGGGAASGTCSSADPINGVCGGLVDTCATPATPAGYIATAGTWTCPGSGGGTSASCNAGVCSNPSVQYTCAGGTVDVASESDSGTVSTWICNSTSGGPSSGTCSVADPVPAPVCYIGTLSPGDCECLVGSVQSSTGCNVDSSGNTYWYCVNGSLVSSECWHGP